MIDVALAFSYMPCPRGRRAGIVGIGGGASVAAADSCERAGLVVPRFTEDTVAQLEKITPIAGTGVKNPVDSPVGTRVSIPDYEKSLKLVASDPQIDFLIIHVTIDWYMRTPEDRKNLRDSTETLLRNKENFGKPAAAVLRSSHSLNSWEAFLEEQKQYLNEGIPVYLTLEDAANAISKMIQYHEFRRNAN
jgi:acyl-CoA synthetase (NDP forming)